MPQLVGGQHVNTGEVKHEIGLHFVEQAGQGFGQQLQVLGIVGAFGQGQVEVGNFFAGGVVAGSVHGKCKHARLVPEDGRRAVALVHVEVDDKDFLHGRNIGKQPGGGRRLVVQQAKSLAPRPKCVVRTARDVERHPVHQRLPGCFDGTAQNGDFALKQRGRPGEARGPLFGPRELAQAQALVIIGIVHPQNINVRGRDGGKKVGRRGRAFVQQLLGQQLIFQHREAVAGRQRMGVGWSKGNGEHPGAGIGRVDNEDVRLLIRHLTP